MCNQFTSTELEFKLLEASIEGPNFFCYHRAGLSTSITSDQLQEMDQPWGMAQQRRSPAVPRLMCMLRAQRQLSRDGVRPQLAQLED